FAPVGDRPGDDDLSIVQLADLIRGGSASCDASCLADLALGSPPSPDAGDLALPECLIAQRLRAWQVPDPAWYRTLRGFQPGRDLVVAQALLAEYPGVRPRVVLGVGAEVLRRGRLALERLIQGPVAGGAEQFLDLAAGLAGPAERDRLLS